MHIWHLFFSFWLNLVLHNRLWAHSPHYSWLGLCWAPPVCPHLGWWLGTRGVQGAPPTSMAWPGLEQGWSASDHVSHCWHWGPGSSWLWGCPVHLGYLAAFLASVHQMPGASHQWGLQTVPSVPWEANLPWVGNHWCWGVGYRHACGCYDSVFWFRRGKERVG